MPVYFIGSEQVSNSKVKIEGALAHHLGDVLRLKIGESLSLVDESPKRYLTRVISTHPDPLVLEVEEIESPPTTNKATLNLGIALLKGEKMDWIVQKATEIGVARLIPVITERTVVQTRADRIARQQQRWGKIAMEAAQQSCRWEVPRIDPPVSFDTLVAETALKGLKLIFSPEALHTNLRKLISSPETSAHSSTVTVLVGPEGGFSSAELTSASKAGFQAASLGDNILRAETAALAALAIVQYEMKGDHES